MHVLVIYVRLSKQWITVSINVHLSFGYLNMSNVVGIDVSKGMSTVVVLQPDGDVMKPPSTQNNFQEAFS